MVRKNVVFFGSLMNVRYVKIVLDGGVFREMGHQMSKVLLSTVNAAKMESW